MKNAIKVAFLSSVITAAIVYVMLGWGPPQPEAAPATGVSWTRTAATNVAVAAAPAPAAAPAAISDDERNNIDVYKKYSPGVVNITATTVSYNFIFGLVPQAGTGSGAIIDTDGHIVTNHHVIEGGAGRGGRLEVTLADKSKYPAKIVGDDPNNDLAVLQIDAPRNRLSTIPLGTSKELQVGQKVLAIGNPYGLERTLTTGIISSLGRSIEASNGRIIEDVIQTDAAINPGNSGGPLLNTSGEIIGINTAIVSPSEGGGNVGIGFAIPADTVQRIVKDLITLGYVRRPYLGVTRNTIALADYPGLARSLDINSEGGLMVVQLSPGSPAAQAGIRGYSREVLIGNSRVPIGGDVILAVDGRAVNSMGELGTAIDRHKPGDKVDVTILRDNRKIDVSVTLQEMPRPVR